MEKTLMLQMMGRIYVGNPIYEKGTDPEGDRYEVLSEVKNVYEFIPIATLIPSERGQMGVLSTFACIKLGTLVSIPDDAVIAEIANDSPYYKEYVKQTTGINVHGASEIPPTSIRREPRH